MLISKLQAIMILRFRTKKRSCSVCCVDERDGSERHVVRLLLLIHITSSFAVGLMTRVLTQLNCAASSSVTIHDIGFKRTRPDESLILLFGKNQY